MSKFKAGDRIVRISKPDSWVPIGYSCGVTSRDKYIDSNGNCMDIEDNLWQLEECHVHHNLIIAWAKGAKIQSYSKRFGNWANTAENNPRWIPDIEYRVAPQQTDSERITELEAKVKKLESRL